MGLLAPLYALAALGIAGPLIFHLIRRQPQGQMQFSSLIFLSPSPPRLTRRSRLDHILLLLLRMLAIVLIAVAFARPYFRQESLLNTVLNGRTVVVLLDTSASMQREDVWEAALAKTTAVLDDLSPDDRLALYTIDDRLSPIISIEEMAKSDSVATQSSARTLVGKMTPTWKASRIGEGLKQVSDSLKAAAIAGQIDSKAVSEVILVTDLHQGCGVEALQGYEWPKNITLDVRQTRPAIPGNARPTLMAADESDGDNESSVNHRIRVENAQDSMSSVFDLIWTDKNGRDLGRSSVQVPPGHVQVVSVGETPNGADRIRLSGDAWEGDNDCFVIEIPPSAQQVAFVGLADLPAEERLDYFLEKAPLSTPKVSRSLVACSAAQLPMQLSDPKTKVLIIEPTDELRRQVESLRQWVASGGTILVCLARQDEARLSTDTRLLNDLFQTDAIVVAEAALRDFALMAKVNYQHPVFLPFADPRFNDFSKIRFWSHRSVQLPADDSLSADETGASTFEVVASFDDQDPMLVQKYLGEGSVWILTAGWQPSASGLALSSKFVPILMGIIDPSLRNQSTQLAFDVGQSIEVTDGPVQVFDADNNLVVDPICLVNQNGVSLNEPGVYRIEAGQDSQLVAMQVPMLESRLTPLDIDSFEQYGIGLGQVASADARRELARQLKIDELERKQRLWQWLIAAAIAVLAVESLVAGVFARRITQLGTA